MTTQNNNKDGNEPITNRNGFKMLAEVDKL